VLCVVCSSIILALDDLGMVSAHFLHRYTVRLQLKRCMLLGQLQLPQTTRLC